MTAPHFRKIVWAHYKKFGRHELPWRKTTDPYKILVSEIMLQQTQAERVVPFYKNFLHQFPTVKALARAPLAEVLKAWQGLGYNRRAKLLQEAAKKLAAKPKPRAPELIHELIQELEALPGVGLYTARAIAAFAYNQDVVLVETNIRTVITHHFFSKKKKISDADIEKVLAEVKPPQGSSREWYSALMDYGAHLKRSGVRLNAKSTHYTKQSKFVGSRREARGAILRALAAKPVSATAIANLLGLTRRAQLRAALTALEREGLMEKSGRRYRLAN